MQNQTFYEFIKFRSEYTSKTIESAMNHSYIDLMISFCILKRQPLNLRAMANYRPVMKLCKCVLKERLKNGFMAIKYLLQGY
jgi:hypothetical protein